jgi:hypothetical protein
MSGVFQKIFTPPPLTAGRVCTPPPPRLWYGGMTHSLGGEVSGRSNFLEDAKHSSVLCICKYFVVEGLRTGASVW